MRRKFIFGAFLIATTFGCVDRVFFDIKIPDTYAISISGFISDEPGPYRVMVTRTFDIESKENLRTGVTATVVLMDADGNSETLKQVTSGVYETSINGMRGKIGGVYKIKVQLEDRRVYESIPDTLFAGSTMEDVHYKFTHRQGVNGLQYEFEIYTTSTTDADLSKVHMMWRNKTTFKALTHPENEGGKCYRIPEEGRCNYRHPCTGIKNIGTDFEPIFKIIGPCTCCICWYDAFNPQVLLSDKIPAVDGRFPEIRIDRVPLSGWYLMYKMRIEASVQSLSPQSFRFWKAVRDQYSAVTNIFQPVIGKIPGNMVRVSGDGAEARGLFYATSISSKFFYVLRYDINEELIPTTDIPGSSDFPCFDKFPNSTTTQPSFWVE